VNVEKGTGPERDLIWAMIFCLVLGLMPMLFSLWVYLFYWDAMQLGGGGPGADAFSENVLALVRILIFGLLPVLGFGFFFVGYFVWKCYRRCKALRKVNDACH
jgi:hypothetical protein